MVGSLTSCSYAIALYTLWINKAKSFSNHNYNNGGVMDSVFAQQSSGCGFDTRLVHMPVMLVTNVRPDVIKANRP